MPPRARTKAKDERCARWNNQAETPGAMSPMGPTWPWWEKECKWNRRCEIFRVPLMRLDEFEHENTYIITQLRKYRPWSIQRLEISILDSTYTIYISLKIIYIDIFLLLEWAVNHNSIIKNRSNNYHN